MHENEIMRAFKTVNDAYIEPVSFIVPRRAETFQGDVYPPTVGVKPAVSASDWFSGKTGLPPKIDLESLYENGAVEEIPADYKPPQPAVAQAAPAATPKPKAAPEPEPTPARREPPPSSMNESKASMGAMADKFADRDEPAAHDDKDDSSFEEIAKPAERPAAVAARMEEKTSSPPITKAPDATSPKKMEPVKTNGASASTSTSREVVSPPASASASTPEADPRQRSTSGVAAGLASHLSDIKSLLEAQRKQMESQTDQIKSLSREVETLKGKVGDTGSSGGGDREREMSERIRQLELELEEARG